jgi:hypothetical protein
MASEADTQNLREIWLRVFDRVRREVDVATVWLAMQAAKPLLMDGSYFVVSFPPESQYLAVNLDTHEATSAIEQALKEVAGRILAFRVIKGQTAEDWQREKTGLAGPDAAASPPPVSPSAASVPPGVVPRHVAQVPPTPQTAPQRAESEGHGSRSRMARNASAGQREVIESWDKLYERLAQGYKTAPLIKYPVGQARFLLESVRMISDTMDVLMSDDAAGPDHDQERLLAKTLERLGLIMGHLDTLFIALELIKYRESLGRNVGLAP